MGDHNYQFRPTLLVGVGGIGCQVAALVYDMAKERHLLEQRLAILGFDTDENDIRELLSAGRMSHRHMVRTSPQQTVLNVLAQDDADVEEWFVPPELLTTEIRGMYLHNGAGQIRMLSRLAFYEALKDPAIEGDINRAIETLTGPSSTPGHPVYEGPINVLLVGTLAGGTGSGMFLQAALHLQDVLKARGATPEIRGVFLLPDVMVSAANIANNQNLNVRANGYAALRELHGILLWSAGLSKRPVRFVYNKGKQLAMDKLPFKSVTLIDYENQTGGQLQGGLEAYIRMAARITHALLLTPIGGSADSVGVNDVRTKHAAAAQGDANYYAGAGMAAAIYPTDKTLDFLSLHYALHILGNEWLELDQRYREELRRYEQRRAGGGTSERRPDRGDSFVRDLQQSADEGITFFSDIHAAVYLKTEDKQGTEVIERRFETYLNALQKRISNLFWKSDAKLRQVHAGQEVPVEGDFSSLGELQNEVHSTESRLRGWRAAVESNLQTQPAILFRNIFADSETTSPDQWKDYHLQHHILHGKVHPVEVRYFLYSLLQLIRERQQGLRLESRRATLERRASRSFDDANTDQIETAFDMLATLRNQSRIAAWFRGSYREFGHDYREYFNDMLRLLKGFAEEKLKAELYHRLSYQVQAILKVLEGFFDELDYLYPQLQQELEEQRTRYGSGRAQLGADVYVYADASARDEIAATLSGILQGSLAAAEVNEALLQALYGQYRAEREPDPWNPAPPFRAEHLFRQHVVDGFCREELLKSHQGKFVFSAVEAVRREARLKGKDPKEYLVSVVDAVAHQAETYLRTRPNAGDAVVFWAISPKNKEQLGAETYTVLEGVAGTDTLVESEFRDDELLCFSTRVNLTPRDLVKLASGDMHQPGGQETPGVYYEAYHEMVNQILKDEANNAGRPSRHFTPHLDRHWHQPGAFPGFTPEEDKFVEQTIFDAYIFGLALERFERKDIAGQPVTFYRDWSRRGEAGERRRLTGSHDDLDMIEAIRYDHTVVKSTLDCAREWRENRLDTDGLTRLQDAADAALYQGLTAPETLLRAVSLCANQTEANAPRYASLAVERLFVAIKGYVDQEMLTLSAGDRLDSVKLTIELQRSAISNLMKQQGYSADVQERLGEIANGTFQRLFSRWQAAAVDSV